jgi:hypothetical protein
MKESVLSMLVNCPICGELNYNKDGYCDNHEPTKETAEDSSTTAPTE